MHAVLDDFVNNWRWEMYKDDWEPFFTTILESVSHICSIVGAHE